eukprot:767726-Hanusia_phi.AAC.3
MLTGTTKREGHMRIEVCMSIKEEPPACLMKADFIMVLRCDQTKLTSTMSFQLAELTSKNVGSLSQTPRTRAMIQDITCGGKDCATGG